MTMSGTHSGSHPVQQPAQGCYAAERSGWEEFPCALPSWARAFPGTAEQVGAARRFAAGLLEGSPFRDDAVVVLSELFTNALLHTASGKPGGLVVVQISRWRRGVRIAVTDQGSASQPVIRDPACGEAAENGNGLYLAAHLARRLDWHDDASGRTVAAIFGQLASMGQALRAWSLFALAPVFDLHVRLAPAGRQERLPGVPGCAPAPTAPGQASFRVAGAGGCWSGGCGEVSEPLPAGEERVCPSGLILSMRCRAWRMRRAGRCQIR
jgi:anti-sigma regulatory factor (Ser/Thr protein kinase)